MAAVEVSRFSFPRLLAGKRLEVGQYQARALQGSDASLKSATQVRSTSSAENAASFYVRDTQIADSPPPCVVARPSRTHAPIVVADLLHNYLHTGREVSLGLITLLVAFLFLRSFCCRL